MGELAVAIDSPLGFQDTVTAGIVSGVDRSIPGGVTPLVGLLQTDADAVQLDCRCITWTRGPRRRTTRSGVVRRRRGAMVVT